MQCCNLRLKLNLIDCFYEGTLLLDVLILLPRILIVDRNISLLMQKTGTSTTANTGESCIKAKECNFVVYKAEEHTMVYGFSSTATEKRIHSGMCNYYDCCSLRWNCLFFASREF